MATKIYIVRDEEGKLIGFRNKRSVQSFQRDHPYSIIDQEEEEECRLYDNYSEYQDGND
jgi:hypothetical protein